MGGLRSIDPSNQAPTPASHGIAQLLEGEGVNPNFPRDTLFSDASDQGWGALTSSSPDPIAGWFIHPQVEEHINLKETRALLEAIQLYNLRDLNLQVYTDSTTLYWYIKKWGGGACTSTPF